MYSLKKFFKLLKIGLDNYLYLIPPGFKFKEVNTIKGSRFIKLNGVNNHG